MNEQRYTVDIQFTRKNGIKSRSWYVKDGKTTVGRYDSETDARTYAAKLNAEAAATVETPVQTSGSAGQTGWSKYSRSSSSRDVAGDYMAGSFGLVSPTAGTTSCHYCGVDRRTCDCR